MRTNQFNHNSAHFFLNCVLSVCYLLFIHIGDYALFFLLFASVTDFKTEKRQIKHGRML